MVGMQETLEGLLYFVTNGAEDVTLVNNTIKDHRIVVPEGQTWEIFGGMIHNGDNVQRNCSVQCWQEDGEELQTMDLYIALAAGAYRPFPRNNQVGSETKYPVRLTGGDYVRFYWAAGGASAGGTAKIHLQRKVYGKYS